MFKTCDDCRATEQCVLCEESYCTGCGKLPSDEPKPILELLREDDYHLLCPTCLAKVSEGLTLPSKDEPIVVVRVIDGAVHGVSHTNGQASLDSARCLILDDYYWNSDDIFERIRFLRTLASVRSLSLTYINDHHMEGRP